MTDRDSLGPIGVLGALDAEIDALRAEMTDRVTPHIHGGRTFERGVIAGCPIVLTASRCGKVAAAATATELIVRYGVSRLIFTGVAGGLGDGVRVGDVVVADAFVQHDLDASPIFPRHEIPLLGRTRLQADPELSELLLDAAGSSGAAGAVHHGLILSGDRFVSTAGERDALRRAFPDALAVEMEGAAVAQVAFEYGVPLAVVRLVSDAADDDAADEFDRNLREHAARTADDLVPPVLRTLAARRSAGVHPG